MDVINPFSLWTEKTSHQPGDTLFLLDDLGEGIYNVWTGTRMIADGDFFVSPEDTVGVPTKYLRGVLRVTPIQRWWVRVRLRDGAEGWIDMDEARVHGAADACG